MIFYFFCLILLLLGLYALATKRNIIKIVMGIKIVAYAVALFYVLIGYVEGGKAPILTDHSTAGAYADPLAQALVPAMLIISLAATAMLLATALRLYQNYRTLDIGKIKELKG